mgnify:FL=1
MGKEIEPNLGYQLAQKLREIKRRKSEHKDAMELLNAEVDGLMEAIESAQTAFEFAVTTSEHPLHQGLATVADQLNAGAMDRGGMTMRATVHRGGHEA